MNHGLRRRVARAVRFNRRGAHGMERGIGSKSFERSNFGAARSPQAPGLLQYPGAPARAGIHTPGDIIVTPRCKESWKVFHSGGVVRARLGNRQSYVLAETKFEQFVEIPAYDDEC